MLLEGEDRGADEGPAWLQDLLKREPEEEPEDRDEKHHVVGARELRAMLERRLKEEIEKEKVKMKRKMLEEELMKKKKRLEEEKMRKQVRELEEMERELAEDDDEDHQGQQNSSWSWNQGFKYNQNGDSWGKGRVKGKGKGTKGKGMGIRGKGKGYGGWPSGREQLLVLVVAVLDGINKKNKTSKRSRGVYQPHLPQS
jgi:vacuolar-type H+-ATPase subunit I/STV1